MEEYSSVSHTFIYLWRPATKELRPPQIDFSAFDSLDRS